MALTKADIERLRRAVADVNVLAQQRLLTTWREVSGQDAANIRDALLDALPALVAGSYMASASYAADWYDVARFEAGVPGRFEAVMPDEPTRGLAQSLAVFGVGPLFRAEADPAAALTLLSGGLQKATADGAREVVRVSAVQDPAAGGWQRSASGGCSFCLLIASRGAVFSESTADFGAHRHCRCVAVPAFGDDRPVKPYVDNVRGRSDETKAKDNARAREWMRGHGLL